MLHIYKTLRKFRLSMYSWLVVHCPPTFFRHPSLSSNCIFSQPYLTPPSLIYRIAYRTPMFSTTSNIIYTFCIQVKTFYQTQKWDICQNFKQSPNTEQQFIRITYGVRLRYSKMNCHKQWCQCLNNIGGHSCKLSQTGGSRNWVWGASSSVCFSVLKASRARLRRH